MNEIEIPFFKFFEYFLDKSTGDKYLFIDCSVFAPIVKYGGNKFGLSWEIYGNKIYKFLYSKGSNLLKIKYIPNRQLLLAESLYRVVEPVQINNDIKPCIIAEHHEKFLNNMKTIEAGSGIISPIYDSLDQLKTFINAQENQNYIVKFMNNEGKLFSTSYSVGPSGGELKLRDFLKFEGENLLVYQWGNPGSFKLIKTYYNIKKIILNQDSCIIFYRNQNQLISDCWATINFYKPHIIDIK